VQAKAVVVADKWFPVSNCPSLFIGLLKPWGSLTLHTAAKTADVILIMLDATKSDEQRRLLEHELDAVGIRLNKSKPDIVFKKKTTGGVRKHFKNLPC
jgi:ribosome-interacting GTPase 1